jgi:hypothetical protein
MERKSKRQHKTIDYRCKIGNDVQYDIYTSQNMKTKNMITDHESDSDHDVDGDGHDNDNEMKIHSDDNKISKNSKKSNKNKENISSDSNNNIQMENITKKSKQNAKRKSTDEDRTHGKRNKKVIQVNEESDSENVIAEISKVNHKLNNEQNTEITPKITSHSSSIGKTITAPKSISPVHALSAHASIQSPETTLSLLDQSTRTSAAPSSLFSSYEALLAEKDAAYDLLFQKFSLLSSQYKFTCSENNGQTEKKSQEQIARTNELVEKLRTEMNEKQARILELEITKEKLLIESNEKQTRITELEASKEKIINEVNDIRNEHANLNSKLVQYENEKLKYQKDHQNVNELLTEKLNQSEIQLKSQTSQHEKEMTTLNSQLKGTHKILRKVARKFRKNQRRSQFLLENYQLLTATRLEIADRESMKEFEDDDSQHDNIKKSCYAKQNIHCKLVNRSMKRIFEFELEVQDDLLHSSDCESEDDEDVEALVDEALMKEPSKPIEQTDPNAVTPLPLEQDDVCYRPIKISLANAKYPKKFQTSFSFEPSQTPVLLRDLLKICYQPANGEDNDNMIIKLESTD